MTTPAHCDPADYQQTLADRAASEAEAATHTGPEVAWVEDLDASGVPARLYIPAGPRGLDDRTPFERGLIVHFHGGGFVFNSVAVHDPAARRLANRTGRSVLSVDYRLAPEHPFPAAVHDADHALAWAASKTRTVIAHGDSAGGSLALVGALRNPGLVSALVLIYPFLDPASSFASYADAGGTWDRDEAQWYWSQYLADPVQATHADAAPLTSPDLATLPPTLVMTAENDIVRDEGEHLLGLLSSQGVTVAGTRFLRTEHAVWRHDNQVAPLMMAQTAEFLDTHLGGVSPA